MVQLVIASEPLKPVLVKLFFVLAEPVPGVLSVEWLALVVPMDSA
jgi:hypothetical protein